MTNQDIYDLIACFDRSTAQTMRLSLQDFTIELTRGGARGPEAPTAAPAGGAEPLPAPRAGETITAPLVGTFYAAPAPEEPPYVTAGAQVKKGDTLCLIEAMKMMSEVSAPCDCVIEEVVKANGELAAFGEPLFRYRPC